MSMPSEITTDVDFFYNFLALHPTRQDLRRHWGALSRFKLLLFVLFIGILAYFFYNMQFKSFQNFSENFTISLENLLK